MKLANKEIDKRVHISLDKTIRSDKQSGIMKFGITNDYPQAIEKLVYGSQTAKACSNILSKFIAGNGFVDDIGSTIVGKDEIGKPITLDMVRRMAAQSISIYGGYYLHSNMTRDGKVTDTRQVPFKNCRLSKKDDIGYCSQIAVYDNWTRDKDLGRYDKKDIVWFPQFNPQTVNANFNSEFKGQIYSAYFDNAYLYPLSPFDSVFLDMDTENQMQTYKNRQIRNGFTDKMILHVNLLDDETEREKLIEKTREMIGADGDNFLMFETTFNEDGEILEDSNFKFQKVDTNINPDLFQNWSEEISNNIRKAAYGLPAVLIDYESGTLSQASGEMVEQAVKVYNAYTRDLRQAFSDSLRDIYKYFPVLKDASFELEELTLIKVDLEEKA